MNMTIITKTLQIPSMTNGILGILREVYLKILKNKSHIHYSYPSLLKVRNVILLHLE